MSILSIFLMLSVLFLVNSHHLLLSLLILESLSFAVLFVLCSSLTPLLLSDFFLLVLFSVFVIEGVLALSGFILVVSFTGSDYSSSSSLLNF